MNLSSHRIESKIPENHSHQCLLLQLRTEQAYDSEVYHDRQHHKVCPVVDNSVRMHASFKQLQQILDERTDCRVFCPAITVISSETMMCIIDAHLSAWGILAAFLVVSKMSHRSNC